MLVHYNGPHNEITLKGSINIHSDTQKMLILLNQCKTF